MAVLLTSKDVSVEFPAKKVLDRVTLGVNEGDRIGIVGKNGDGKTTLLNTLAGLFTPDSGEVIRSGTPTIGLLGQADAYIETDTVKRSVLGDVPEYTWSADRRIREIVASLIGDIDWERPVGDLSGGQLRRVSLTSLLIRDWDILMLDEPTNHLDMKAIAWLADHLATRWQNKAGALLVITHDRWFLDEVALSMWEVHDGMVESFEGGFSAYIQQRVERERLALASEEKRRNHLRKELVWLSHGAPARTSKPKFRLKAARDLLANDPPVRNTLELKQTAMTRLGKQVFELVDVSVSYGETRVLDRLNWLIGPGDRYGILGENGVGKTTLLNLLSGRITPSSGHLKIGQTVKSALLSQRLEGLVDVRDDRVREVLGRHKTRLVIGGKSVSTSQLLERLGFEREHMQSFVRDLSGGQKRRLSLLLALAEEPNVLILDEPGNDMDVDMLAVMEDMLDSWPGTLLLVSHDRYLMERVTDDQFALINGKLRHMPGGVDEYLKTLKDIGTLSFPITGAHKAAPRLAEPSSSCAKKPGGETYQIKKQLASIERRIAALEEATRTIKDLMHDADPSDYLSLAQFQEKLHDIEAQIIELEESWIELSL